MCDKIRLKKKAKKEKINFSVLIVGFESDFSIW